MGPFPNCPHEQVTGDSGDRERRCRGTVEAGTGKDCGEKPEDSSISLRNHLCISAETSTCPQKMFHALSKPGDSGSGGGRGVVDWLQMDFFPFSNCFCVDTFLGGPQASLSSAAEPTLTPTRG